jgi:hypothetical protein
MSQRIYDVAELVVASWKLANGGERMPTSHGILDRALKELVATGPDLPAWVGDSLTFADTRVGLRCLELPEILDSAQENGLTSEPNPTYVTTAIKIDDLICRRILRDLGISEDAARRWGARIRDVATALSRENEARPVLIDVA